MNNTKKGIVLAAILIHFAAGTPVLAQKASPLPRIVAQTLKEDYQQQVPNGLPGSCTINITLPQLDTPLPANGNRFNAMVRALLDKRIATCKAEADDPSRRGLAAGVEGDYEVMALTAELASVRISLEINHAGAAHPSTETEVINFAFQEGREITLAELFTDGTPFLPPMADYCRQALRQQLADQADEGIVNGTKPVAEHYSKWNITPQGLFVTFEEYQVASYAAGRQEVMIPYAALSGLNKNSSLLSPFLQGSRRL